MAGRKKKATDDQILEAYDAIGNVWKVAEVFGMCGQSVHERLVKLGKINKIRTLTPYEKQMIIDCYASGVTQGDGKLKDLSMRIDRCLSYISYHAKKLGISDGSRGKAPEMKLKIGDRVRRWYSQNPHPKGFLGGKHSDSAKQVIALKSKETWANMSEDQRADHTMKSRMMRKQSSPRRPGASWKCGWREIGDTRKYYRSRWEANYARYLEWLRARGEIASWEHEPETFWFDGIKRGVVSYLPDFKITGKNGAVEYHEVKGWMDDRSRVTISRMAKYHPNIRLIVIDKRAYTSIAKTMKPIITDWE